MMQELGLIQKLPRICVAQAENANPQRRNQRPGIDFLDDTLQGLCTEDIQGLFASAFRAESRLQSHAGRWPVLCRFQRCSVGPQRGEYLYDEDPKDRPYLRRCLWKPPAVHCKAEGKEPTIRSGLSFDTPTLSSSRARARSTWMIFGSDRDFGWAVTAGPR